MNHHTISPRMIEKIASLLNRWNIDSVVRGLIKRGGKIYIVGGAVRDLVLELPIEELDIEIHNLSLEDIVNVLSLRGRVNAVGKVYGVLKIEGIPIDWSLPRIDAPGRKPVVAIDPRMDIAQALRRRDLTMNAMAIDLSDFSLIDPFKGRDDIEHRRLRTPDTKLFVEDPLRLYRVMQFVSRFSMEPDEALDHVCKGIDVTGVSRERIEEEMRKLMLKSTVPSQGLRWLARIGRLRDIFPALADLQGVKQDPLFHPEGDVFEHTMQSLDAAAHLSYANDNEKIIIMYAALCHDMGKVTTTSEQRNTIRSLGHEKESSVLAQAFLNKLVGEKDLIKTVTRLVAYHMAPLQLVTQNSSPAAYKRLAVKLAPYANINMLCMLALADKRGRNSRSKVPLEDDDPLIITFKERAKQMGVLMHPEKPLLKGADFLDIVPPGPLLGKLVKQAYTIQINKEVRDKKELKKRVLDGISLKK